MSIAATFSDHAPRERTETRTILLIVWATTVISYLTASLHTNHGFSTDDAMRLVQVRDFLAGQGWFDLTQYRLSPPEGVAMHWSRLIDLPLAALIAAGAVVLPAAQAEQVAAVVWPAGLLLIVLAGVARLARELAGDAAARLALIFVALMAPVLQHFRPGAIDHHNVQLVLLVWPLALALGSRWRGSAIAGGMCALSLAIGQEMTPAIAAIAGTVGMRWVIRGESVKQGTAAFALAFAAATLALFALTVAPALYAVPACDALSIVQVTAAITGGAGLAALTVMAGTASIGRRLAGATVLGLGIATTMVLAFPACLGDPYAHLDPRLSTLWLSNVNEARSIFSMLRDIPQEVPAYFGLPAAALVLALAQGLRLRDDARWIWILCIAGLAALSLVALWQVRGAAAANAVALVLVPAALVRAWPVPGDRAVFLGLGRAALAAALVLNPLTLIALGSAAARALDMAGGARRPIVIAEGPGTCRRAADYAPLASLPRGLVLGFIDAGPFLLMETPHAVLAAPYHRNVRGNSAMLDVFLARPDQAVARLDALGVAYVAFCPGAPERYNYAAESAEGFAAALARGEVPDGLERIPLAGTDLIVYRPRL
ncbi:MAG: hypothetical protein QOI12_4903 [Alphaproteobacteria bacterium]|jgi:hypothetical protein|nr:hypothetical protein [Alphaproteobacteria bacterium]